MTVDHSPRAGDTPPTPGEPRPTPRAPAGDATGGVIPYKNVPALIAYYLGVFSIIPMLGLPLGIGALVLGILGLGKRKREPHISGAAHAWIGIVLGGLMTLLWGGVSVVLIVAAISSHR